MKKGLFIFVTLLLTVAMLTACGRPRNMTKDTYDNGCRALEVMDKYNDMEVSADDAKDRLESLRSSMLKERETLVGFEETNNLLVDTDLLLFTLALGGTSGNTYEIADDLRHLLGK